MEILTMGAEKYDWRSKIKSDKNIADLSAKGDKKCDWRFGDAIGNTIEVVEAEQKARREREAAEKARFEKARQKAMMVRDQVILPLLNGLRDNFAANERQVLPEWRVQSDEDADRFSAEAVTPNLDASGTTCFTIKAEASLEERGEFVNLSVVCSSVNSKSTSANQLASLVDKTAKFPTAQKFDELGSRTWFHKQLAECAKMCILTKMRQFPTSDADSGVNEGS